jgi:molybdate transport system permease protein
MRLSQIGILTLASLGLTFLALPIAALVIRAITTRAWEGAPGSLIPDAISLSFITTLATAIFTLLFGTPLAYIFARRKFRFKRLLNVLIELPIVLPPAVAGLALLITFGRRGLLGPPLLALGISLPFTVYAVIMAQAFVAAPFYIRAAQIGFRGVPVEIEDAARVDGAGGWRLFIYITLPLSSHALAAGLILSWARALGEFGAMPLIIYNIIEQDINAAIWTGLILIGLGLLALLLSQWLSSLAQRNLHRSEEL